MASPRESLASAGECREARSKRSVWFPQLRQEPRVGSPDGDFLGQPARPTTTAWTR